MEGIPSAGKGKKHAGGGAIARQAPAGARFSPSEIYRGRNVFVLGATGFVGKVLLSMLFHRFPDVGKVYVMVRRGSGTSSEARFWASALQPTNDARGSLILWQERPVSPVLHGPDFAPDGVPAAIDHPPQLA